MREHAQFAAYYAAAMAKQHMGYGMAEGVYPAFPPVATGFQFGKSNRCGLENVDVFDPLFVEGPLTDCIKEVTGCFVPTASSTVPMGAPFMFKAAGEALVPECVPPSLPAPSGYVLPENAPWPSAQTPSAASGRPHDQSSAAVRAWAGSGA